MLVPVLAAATALAVLPAAAAPAAAAASGRTGATAAPAKSGAAATSAAASPSAATGLTASQSAAEASASRQAESSGKAVAVAALTTEYSTTTANPTGSFSYDESALPERVQRDGAWVPVSTTLVRDADGGYSPAATLSALTISGGGAAPLATMTDGADSLAVSWPARLPAPTVSGSSATYHNVLPGVDLQVTATVFGGFSDVLVVHDAQAAANPALAALRFPVTAHGVTLRADAAGDLTAADAKGAAVFTAAAPTMWDSNTALPATVTGRVSADASSAAASGLAAAQRPLGVRLSGGALTLLTDHTLLTSKRTRFPVYIDPSYAPQHYADGAKQDFDEVKQGCATDQLYNNTGSAGDDGQLGVGYDDFAGGCEGTMRAYYQLAVPSQIYGSTVSAAYLDSTVVYAAANGTNDGNKVYLHWTSPINSKTDWSDQPGAGTTVTSASFNTGNNFPNTAVSFTVTTQMKDAASGKWSNWTVGLRDAYETSNDIDFVRFADNPHLEITYDHTPDVPGQSGLKVTSGTESLPCVTSSPLPWLGKTASVTPPTLSAKIADPDNDAVSATFTYWKSGGSTAALNSAIVASNGTAPVTLPTSFITGLGTTTTSTIEFKATAYDGLLRSASSVTCEFNYDPTTPGAPSVSSTVYPPAASGTGAAAGTVGSFALTAASGVTVTRFVYRLDYVPATGSGDCTAAGTVAASGNGATINLAAPAPGTHTLYAYSCDASGNISDLTSYQFTAAGDPNQTYSSLSAAFDNIAVSTSTTESGSASADGSGNALPLAGLEAQGWTPGGTVTVDGAQLTLPDFGTGADDNALAANQTIDVGQSGNALVFLAFSTNGGNPSPAYSAQPGDDTAPLVPVGDPVAGIDCTIVDTTPSNCAEPTGSLTYTTPAGTTATQSYFLNAPDWVAGSTSIAATVLPDRTTSTGTAALPTKIYAFAVPLTAGDTLSSVTLPDVSNSELAHVPGLHILAMGVRDTTTANAPSGQSWTGAWQAPTETVYPPASGSWDDQTVRTVVRPTLGGSTLRVTLSNEQNTAPLKLGAVTVAPEGTGAAASAAPIALTFGGAAGVTIPAGGEAISDPLTLTSTDSFSSITAGESLLLSYEITSTSLADISGHSDTATSYDTASGSGNHTGDTAATSFASLGSYAYLVTGLDVATAGTPAVALLGDHLVVASGATPQVTVQRTPLDLYDQGVGYGVLAGGIEDNRIDVSATGAGGYSLLARLDRDVLTEPGLTTVVVDEGLVDLLDGSDDDTLLSDYAALVTQLNAWGINVVFTTLTPCSGYAPCTATVDGYRMNVNEALTDNYVNDSLTPYADTVDFDGTVSSTNATTGVETLIAAADSGDHVNLTGPGFADLVTGVDADGNTIAGLLGGLG
jgi:hypothetical protein